MWPLAPDLFSTTTCRPSVRDKWSPTTRAATSVEPPAGNGTMKWTGRSGQSPAMAMTGAQSVKARIKQAKGAFIIEVTPASAAGFGYLIAPASVRPATPSPESPQVTKPDDAP